jgi:flagellum-specific peptidoglycan hydrolase FlgJ
VTPREFVARLALALEPTSLSLAAREIVIAHGAHESGWGKSEPSRFHNFWNLTRTKNDPLPVVLSGDVEFGKDGRAVPIVQRFRAYTSDWAAVEDYLGFLQRPRYLPAYEALLAGNAAEFVRRLRDDDPATRQLEGGFFTAPLAPYQASIAGCLATVRRLLAMPEGVA